MDRSPPCGWCGLKSSDKEESVESEEVTTLRVVWIEIFASTVQDWCAGSHHLAGGVDWNQLVIQGKAADYGHHLAGGVDWNLWKMKIIVRKNKSPPCGWCGLKFPYFGKFITNDMSPPCGWCGLKSQEQLSYYAVPGHHLAGGVLRGNILLRLGYLCKSPKYIAITFFVGNTMGEFIEKSMIWDREHDKYIMNT